MRVLLALVALAAFPIPAALVWRRSHPGSSLEDGLDALGVGHAGALVLLAACSAFDFRLYDLLWVGAAALAVPGLVRTPPWGSRTPARATSRLLIALLGLALAARLAPLWVNPHPLGWDPNFHVLLAGTIAEGRRAITDWRPFEDIPLTYPIGSHLLLAWASDVSRAPLPTVFGVATAWFTLLGAAQVGALVSRALRSPERGLWAAAAYAFWAIYGGLAYAQWGGLPNAMGMYLLLVILGLIVSGHPRPYLMRAVPLLWIAIVLVHHHVMLAAAAVLGVILLDGRRRRDQEMRRRLLLPLALAAALSAPLLVRYVAAAPRVGQTGIGAYFEPMITLGDIATGFGGAFLFGGLVGAVLQAAGRRPLGPVYRSALAALLAAFVALEYGARLLARAFWGHEVALFTPSRFLTDAVVLLSVFPACLLLVVRRRVHAGLAVRASGGRRPGLRALRASAGRARLAVAALVVALAALNSRAYASLFQDPIPPERIEAWSWIRAHTAPDTLVLDDYVAASAYTRRPSSSLPLPSSELWSLARNRRTALAILAGRAPVSSAGRPVVLVREGGAPAGSPYPALWQHPGGLVVLALWPGP